jgi:hypothetical protein
MNRTQKLRVQLHLLTAPSSQLIRIRFGKMVGVLRCSGAFGIRDYWVIESRGYINTALS